MEFEIFDIELDMNSLLILVNLMANESESAVGYFNLLLELKHMGLSLNIEDGQKIVVPFTIKNVLDILNFLSAKNANIYSGLFVDFKTSIETALEGKEDRTEAQYLIINRLIQLEQEKTIQLNQDYQNGINILRLEQNNELPT